MNILFIYLIQVKAIIFRFISSTPFEFVRTRDHAACRIFHEYTVVVVECNGSGYLYIKNVK